VRPKFKIEDLHNLQYAPKVIRVIKLSRMTVGHVIMYRRDENVLSILAGTLEEHLGDLSIHIVEG